MTALQPLLSFWLKNPGQLDEKAIEKLEALYTRQSRVVGDQTILALINKQDPAHEGAFESLGKTCRLLAEIIQHRLDHIDGTESLDHLMTLLNSPKDSKTVPELFRRPGIKH